MLRRNHYSCSGVIPLDLYLKNSNKSSSKGKSRQLYSGTETLCFWLLFLTWNNHYNTNLLLNSFKTALRFWGCEEMRISMQNWIKLQWNFVQKIWYFTFRFTICEIFWFTWWLCWKLKQIRGEFLKPSINLSFFQFWIAPNFEHASCLNTLKNICHTWNQMTLS